MTLTRAFRAILALLALSLLTACAGSELSGPNATPEEAARAAYRSPEPPSITLYTMINNRSDSGAHTAMMINAPSQRVVFDPAGAVRFQSVPEIDDVLYGITPDVAQAFASAHAREAYRVQIQQVTVPPEVAERALRLVQQNGPVGQAGCTSSTSRILRQLPGFETIPSALFPSKLMEAFGKLPNVTTTVLREQDGEDKNLAIQRIEAGWNLMPIDK